MTDQGYDLTPVTTPDDWRHYHRLRRTVLWEARGRRGYDKNHPDDRRSGHHPFVLRLNGQAIGTVRLDEIGDGTGAVRLVAIAPDIQRRGHGRRLMILTEEAARHLGLDRLAVNAARDAIGFYTIMGWSPGAWADPNPGGAEVACEQMVKPLAPALGP